MQETRVRSLDWEDPLEKEMTTHSNIVAWEIPWTEDAGRLHTVHGVAKELDMTEQLTSNYNTYLFGHIIWHMGSYFPTCFNVNNTSTKKNIIPSTKAKFVKNGFPVFTITNFFRI